jgi:5-methylthioadenosine/S-adenosylhomocysteine deaminase
MRILITDVRLIQASTSSARTVDLGIENGRISFIREHSLSNSEKGPHQESWDRIVEGQGRLILPGLINAHTHLGMTLLRGYGDDLPLMVWLQEKM